jgi:hypothetical protein
MCRERTQIASGECVCDRCMGRLPGHLYRRLRECARMRRTAEEIWRNNLSAALQWVNEDEI